MADYNIHKNPRNKDEFFHKQPKGLNVKETKALAMHDISKEEKNYVNIEWLVVKYYKFTLPYIPIDTLKL